MNARIELLSRKTGRRRNLGERKCSRWTAPAATTIGVFWRWGQCSRERIVIRAGREGSGYALGS